MLILRRFLILMCLLAAIIIGFLTLRFGSALSQEGNPTPILASIAKLEFSNDDHVQFFTSDRESRYVSANTGEFRYDVVKTFMKQLGYDFKEQMGSGLVFDKDGQNVVIETRQYTKHYILWDIPNKVLS